MYRRASSFAAAIVYVMGSNVLNICAYNAIIIMRLICEVRNFLNVLYITDFYIFYKIS